MFGVEIVHSCTRFGFWPGSNDGCLSTTGKICIFGGSSVTYDFIIVVLLHI